MSVAKRVSRQLGLQLAPKVTQAAPELTAGFVHQALTARSGASGPLDGAAVAADKELAEHGGNIDDGDPGPHRDPRAATPAPRAS